MRLHSDWKAILKHAWSVRFFALSALLIMVEPVCEVLMSLSDGFPPLIRLLLSLTSGTASLVGIWARVVVQEKLQPKDYSGEETWPD